MADVPKRYFTRREVDRLIPGLGGLLERVKEAHAEGARLRQAMHDAQRRVAMVGGARLEQEAWRARRRALERATTTVQQGLREILELGGIPKDLDLGLVDFPAWMDGREVNLCWRLGEPRVQFWHGLDEGYTGRKPLPVEPEGGDPA